MTPRQHTAIAVVIAIFGMYLLRISMFEIQPWDEGLYAARGESIVKYGDVWDQSAHSIGGEYSSIPAPVTSWGVAIGIKVFGRTILGVRFFTLLCSLLSLLLLYSISSRLMSHQAGIVAVLLMGTAIPWVVYSRQAMSEVPLVFGMLLAWWSVLRLSNPQTPVGKPQPLQSYLLNVAFLSLGIAISILSKNIAGLLPILLLAYAWKSPVLGRRILLGGFVGLLIALPWFVVMAVNHTEALLGALMLPHVFSSVEGNAGGGSVFYYVNQLLLAQPGAIIAMLLPIILIKQLRELFKEERWLAVVCVWLYLGLIIFSLSQTKNPHYVVLLIPPIVLLITWAFHTGLAQFTTRSTLILMFLLLPSIVWVVMPGLRDLVQNKVFPGLIFIAGVMILVTLGMALGWVSKVKAFMSRKSISIVQNAIYILCAIGLLRSLEVVFNGKPEHISGGRKVATVLLDNSEFVKQFCYLYHAQNEADSLNPQLSWYTAGWMNGWQEGLSYTHYSMPRYSSDLNAVALAQLGQPLFIVYYHPSVPEDEYTNTVAGAAAMYNVELQEGSYTIFRRR